jgi:hypothetical protein
MVARGFLLNLTHESELDHRQPTVPYYSAEALSEQLAELNCADSLGNIEIPGAVG